MWFFAVHQAAARLTAGHVTESWRKWRTHSQASRPAVSFAQTAARQLTVRSTVACCPDVMHAMSSCAISHVAMIANISSASIALMSMSWRNAQADNHPGGRQLVQSGAVEALALWGSTATAPDVHVYSTFVFDCGSVGHV